MKEQERSTTHKLRKQLGMTSEQFAQHFGIPVGTVRNWDSRGTMPGYVGGMIQKIIDLEKFNN